MTSLAIFLICAFGCAACGGGSTTPFGPPPVTARTTFTLDVPADHIGYSQPLGQLVAGQTFDLLMTVVQINRADTETFAHSVDFWLVPAGTEMPFSLTATSLTLAWSSGTQWVVGYLSHPGAFSYTNVRPTITTGAQRAVRITRTIDGSAQLWLDGVNLWTVADADSAPTLFTQVVGLRVDFAY